MKIKQALFTAGYSSFYFDDQQAIKNGAGHDGFFYTGEPVTQGFNAVRQAGECVSVQLILENGAVAVGDCAAVQYSGAGGRDPLFLAEHFIPFLNDHIKPLLVGRDVDAFLPNARFFDKLRIDGNLLHTAVRYGLSQALLDATALATGRLITETLQKPLQIRHGTPDARLLAEISMASGFTSYEGGGISYNIPYAKRVTLEKSIRDWQYCDRLMGMYEEHGIRINREPFGPLTGTLIPPFISHSIAIIEGLLALEQGVKSITVGYGQVGSLTQDVAAIQSLRELAHEYFQSYGYTDYELSTVFHQWMGGFPEDESKAFAIISWGAAVAGMSGATKVITKSPHEAWGIPTATANIQGLKASRQMLNMVNEQKFPPCPAVELEIELIKSEVRAVLNKVFELGNGDIARGTVLAFEAGVLDVPFAPAACNAGKILPVRDNTGAIRVLEAGAVPLPKDILDLHHDYVAERARFEGRQPTFQMVVDDINAVSHSKLIGRP